MSALIAFCEMKSKHLCKCDCNKYKQWYWDSKRLKSWYWDVYL